MKFKFILFNLLLNAFLLSYGQEIPTKKIETKFFRPALTNLFVSSNSNEANTIIAAAAKVDPEMRFDNNNLTQNVINVNIGSQPEFVIPEDITKLSSARKEYNAALVEYKKNVDAEIQKQLAPISRSIVGKWFSVNSNGEMSDELINQRGNYTATDTDAIKDKASENSRLNQMGYDLINRSYVAIYRISSVKNMEQVYDEIDAAARKVAAKLKKSFVPVKRIMEGYEIKYTASIYKLDWKEEVSSNFYNSYYVDASTSQADKQSKVSAFNQSNYPMVFVAEVSGEISSIQSNDPKSYVLTKRKTMKELLEVSFPDIQEDAMYMSSKKIDDFRVKSPIFSNYPTLSKIGTKEGIYLDQRFFVYELDGDKKVKKGIVNVAKISDNIGVATGETKPSKFRQASGKKIEPFHFLESKEDRGFSVTLGYTPGADVNAANGFHVSLDARVNRFMKVKEANASTLTRGVNLSFNFAYNMIDEKVFNGDTQNSEGTSMLAGLSLGKEMPLTKKGNIYIFPQVGVNYLSFDFTKFDGEEIADEYEDEKSWTAISANFSFGIGLNIAQNLSFIVKPSYNMVVTNFEDAASSDVVADYLLNNKWSKINDPALLITYGLRLKL